MTSISDDCKTCQICFSTHYKTRYHIDYPAFHLHFSLLTARLIHGREYLILSIERVKLAGHWKKMKEKRKALKG